MVALRVSYVTAVLEFLYFLSYVVVSLGKHCLTAKHDDLLTFHMALSISVETSVYCSEFDDG